jgi:hypothetical protein
MGLCCGAIGLWGLYWLYGDHACMGTTGLDNAVYSVCERIYGTI